MEEILENHHAAQEAQEFLFGQVLICAPTEPPPENRTVTEATI
jgi:hypothetical protein